MPQSYNQSIFISKSAIKHNNFYSYQRTSYINSKTKVIITCPTHGDFLQRPFSHLKGDRCAKCYYESKALSQEEFIDRAVQVHENTFLYDKVIFTNLNTKVDIICRIHGKFSQRPSSHLNGQGCKKCVAKSLTSNTKNFIKTAIDKHNNFFLYDRVNYINNCTKVSITCPIHGTFEQLPSNHLKGLGCAQCHISKGEQQIAKIIQQMGFESHSQVKIQECKNKQHLPFDVGIYKKQNLLGLVEYHGIQHFEPVEHFGGSKDFEKRRHRDQIKEDFCKQNDIPLLIIPYTEFNNIEQHLKTFINASRSS